VRAEVPGIDKEHLTVELAGDLLTIRGERQQDEKAEDGAVYCAEITRAGFSRTLRLPVQVRADAVNASFENGLLEVHLPKAEVTQRQRIEIK